MNWRWSLGVALILFTLGKQVQSFEGISFKAEIHKKLLRGHNATAVEVEAARQAMAQNVEQISAWAAPDGHVLWTLASYAWLDFALNWVATVSRAGVEHFFVATLDDKLLKELKGRGIPSISLNSNLGLADIKWGSDAFKNRGVEKIKLIIKMLEAGLQPLFSDLDVVWLRDPLPYVRLLDRTNMLVSSDSCDIVPHVRLDNCPRIVGTEREIKGGDTYVGKMNVGIHLLRPSALPFAEAWLEEMKSTGNMEQLCWNNVFLRNMILYTEGKEADPFCWAMDREVVAGILPASHFQNGHTYFIQRIHQPFGIQPYAVHASYIAHKPLKTFHFRESLHWHVDPMERFGRKHRLLTIDLDLPPEMVQRAGPPEDLGHDLREEDAAGHFALIQHQYVQIKAAAELAKALDRQLVMPQLWCGVENLWFPHQGRMHGGMGGVNYDLPTPCVMSQLFNLAGWMDNSTEGGPLPPFLESSYLENDRVTFAPGDDVTVGLCGKDGACKAGGGFLDVEEGLSKSELLSALEEVEHVRLLSFRQIHHILPQRHKAQLSPFDEAFAIAIRPFCCLEGNHPVTVDVPPHPEKTT